MILLKNLSLRRSAKVLLDNASVSINPGATQLTVIPRLASSSASALLAPIIPALAAL